MSAHPDGMVAAVSRNEAYSFSKPKRDEIVLIAGLGVEGDAHAGVTVRHQARVRADPTQPNLRQVHLIHDELFDELRELGFDVRPGQLGENVTTRGIDLLGLPRGTILRFGPPPADAGDRAAAGDGAAPAAAAARNATVHEEPAAGDGAAPAAAAARNATVHEEPAAGDGTAHEEPAAGEGTAPDRAAARGVTAMNAVGAVVAAAGRAELKEPAANAVAALVDAAGRAGPPGRATVVVTGLRNPCGQINGFRPGLLTHVIGKDPDGNLVRKGGVMAVVLRGGPIRPGDPVTVELPPPPHLSLEPV